MPNIELFEKYFDSYMSLSDYSSITYSILPALKLYGECHRQLSTNYILEDDTKDMLSYCFGLEGIRSDYDIKLAVEGFFSSIYSTIIEFFKSMIRKVTDYVRDLFNWHHSLTARNKKALADLKPYFMKYKDHLDKVMVPSTVPSFEKLDKVTHDVLKFTTQLLKINVRKLENDVNDVLSGKKDEVVFMIDYSEVFGHGYLEDFENIGLTVTDAGVNFNSVITGDQSNGDSVASLGYMYDKLDRVNAVYDKQMEAQLHQMKETIHTLEKVKMDIERLGHTKELDSVKEDRNKKLVLELPPQILRAIGLMQKCSAASATYQTKLNEVMFSLLSSFKTFGNTIAKT